MPRRRATPLLDLALFAGSALVCIAVTETVFCLALRGIHRSVWERNSLHDSVSQAERARGRPPSEFRLPATLDQEPRLRQKPEPWPPEFLKEHVDWTRKLASFLPGSADRLIPNVRARSVVGTLAGRGIYDVEVTSDAFGRRTTVNPHPERRTKYLAVFGCSFTFGEGVSDGQTLPSRIAALAPGHFVYNYGYPGAGPFRTMRDLLALDLPREIPQTDGAAIYNFVDMHVRRMTPSIIYLETSRFLPYYEVGGDGELRTFPSYASAHPIMAAFYGLLSHSWTLDYFRYDYPLTLTIADYRRAARMIHQLQNVYERRFGNDRFYVVLFPHPGGSGFMPRLLEEEGVKYLDYETVDLRLLTRGRATHHPYDLHPTAEAYALVAKHVAIDLQLTGSSRASSAPSTARR